MSLRCDLLGVVQAGPADGRAGQLHGLQFGHRRDRPGLAHLHIDRQQPCGGFPLLPFVSHHPARTLRRRAQPLALGKIVDLQHQPVDLEVQLVQFLDQPVAVLDGGVERGKAFDHGGRRQSVPADLAQEVHVVRSLDSLAVPDAVAEHAQPAFRTDPRVQHPHGTGGQIAGIGVRRLPGGLLPLVQRDQIRIGHVDLAADFEHRRHIRAGQPQGHIADRPHVVRNVVPDDAVAAGQGPRQHAVLVNDGDRRPVHLEFHDPFDRLAFQQATGPPPELAQLVGVIGVFDRQHRHAVPDLVQLGDRLVADPLRGAVGRDQLRMLGFQVLEPLQQAVVFQVADFRLGLDVVLAVVIADLVPQAFDFLLRMLAHRDQLPDGSSDSMRRSSKKRGYVFSVQPGLRITTPGVRRPTSARLIAMR